MYCSAWLSDSDLDCIFMWQGQRSFLLNLIIFKNNLVICEV